jgi:alpha-D-ribose 1-methylphosphonate 5-triphosphate diphosphatase
MDVQIERGRVLIGGALTAASLHVSPDDGAIRAIDETFAGGMRLDAAGLLVLPGIVDIHGDSLEKQMLPRPTAAFPIDVALLECDRQAVANGITTLFHGVMWSWEPGLRGADRARAVLDAIERLRPRLAADTRYHLRHEVYNLDGEEEIIDWMRQGRIAMLAFNDHITLNLGRPDRQPKLDEMVARSGLGQEAFIRHAQRVMARKDEVPASIGRLAAAAVASGVPIASHDETSPEQRRWFHAIGCRVAEFPTNAETAAEAAAHGDHIVFGAPNVVRGGSHTGWVGAADMIRRGLCSVLASDYYYPSQLLAAFRLVADEVMPLPEAWRLISEAPAAAVGLDDRGRIEAGRRADLLLVDDQSGPRPRVVAAIVAGRVAYLTETQRLVL